MNRRPGKGLGMAAKVKSVSSDSVSKPVVVKSEEKKVLEAFLEEEESKKVAEREQELQPIGYEVVKPRKHEPQKKERMGAGEMASVVIKGPEVPEHVKRHWRRQEWRRSLSDPWKNIQKPAKRLSWAHWMYSMLKRLKLYKEILSKIMMRKERERGVTGARKGPRKRRMRTKKRS